MKKIIHKTFLVSIFITISLLLVSSILKKTSADDENTNNLTLVTGIIQNESGAPVSNKTIEFIDESGEIKEATTNNKGEYYINIEKGKYTIKTDNILEASGRNYSDIDGINLEIAFIYSESVKDRIKCFNYKFLKDFRFIDKNPVNSNSELVAAVSRLKLNPASDEAFHINPAMANSITGNQNRCLMVFVLPYNGTITEEYIDNLVRNIQMFSGDYNVLQLKEDTEIQNIIKKIYEILEKGDNFSELSNIVQEGQVDNLEINSTTILNFKIKEEVSEKPSTPMPTPSGPSDFITGKISGADIKKNVTVTLKKDNTTVETKQTDENGQYSLGYYGEGTYNIQFSFDPTALSGTLNGQYYEFDGGNYKKIKNISDNTFSQTTNNCLKNSLSTLQNVKNKFQNNFMFKGYELDLEKLSNGTANSTIKNNVKLEAKTENFIVDFSNDFEGDLKDYKVIANVKLKERPKFSLTVKQKINQFKIVLTNGQVFKQFNSNNNEDRTKYEGSLVSKLFNITFEDSSRYGAKLYIEYEIEISNNSEIDCKDYQVLLGFDNLEYDKSQYLLSDITKKNESDSSISIVNDINDEDNGYTVRNNTAGKFDIDDYTVFLNYTGSQLKKHDKKIINVTLTKALDAKGKDNEDCIFKGFSEIVTYENSEGRRNYSSDENDATIVKAGSYAQSVKVMEEDESEAELLAIVPPTGLNIWQIVSIGTLVVIIFILSVKITDIKIQKKERIFNEKK